MVPEPTHYILWIPWRTPTNMVLDTSCLSPLFIEGQVRQENMSTTTLETQDTVVAAPLPPNSRPNEQRWF